MSLVYWKHQCNSIVADWTLCMRSCKRAHSHQTLSLAAQLGRPRLCLPGSSSACSHRSLLLWQLKQGGWSHLQGWHRINLVHHLLLCWFLPKTPAGLHRRRCMQPEFVVHRVRAQNRPFHGAWISIDLDALDASSNPVVDSWGFWSDVKVPGQIVLGQLFVKVIRAAWAPTWDKLL